MDDFENGRHPGESRGPGIFKSSEILDSGFRRNDRKRGLV